MSQDFYSPQSGRQAFRRPWEVVFWIAFLAACLVAGLLLGNWAAPQPVIGVVRFDATIDLYTAARLIDVLEAARQDARVAGVVIEITSPGGLATSSESIFYSMLKVREGKPLVTVIDGLAVSGGYYMAVAASRIYAPASSYVGNIGTRGPRPVDPVIAPEELSSGPYKLSGGNRFDHIHQLDLVKAAFVNNVVHQRSHAELNPLKIDANTVAEARIYLGSEAVAIGLVDAEGGRSDAIIAAAQMAGVARYRVVDLLTYFGIDGAVAALPYESAVKEMVETAPPDAIFLLDSRIPLTGLDEGSAVDQHLLKLRAAAPASLPIQSQAQPQVEPVKPVGE